MTQKIATPQRACLPLVLWLFLLSSDLPASAATAAGDVRTAHPARFSASAARETGTAEVVLLDNAFLDRFFQRGRATGRQQDKPRDQARVEGSGAAKPGSQRPALLRPDDSFAAKITPRTAPALAVALRYAEQGRKLIGVRQYQRAVNDLERAAALGQRNYLPYIYYYLAQTHHYLANYDHTFNFLDVAESWLREYADWMDKIAALRKANLTATGYLPRATSSNSTGAR